MFGVLVGHLTQQECNVGSNADARAVRRLTWMFNLIAWMPVVVLALKKAV